MSDLLNQIKPLVFTMEVRDAYTQGHSQRVADYAVHLAQWLGRDTVYQTKVNAAGMLHDLGKIGIPDEILLKPGKLSESEYSLIKLHSTLSKKIIEKMKDFEELEGVVLYHHENYDGSGYPAGLKGDEIPEMSRIISIVDVFDALTTRRIYRDGVSKEHALEMMDEELKKGKFDPAIYEVFRKNIVDFQAFDASHAEQFAFPELEERRTSFLFRHRVTSLLNRDALLAFLRKGSSREAYAFLVEINLAQFSNYNELYGLLKADELLRQTAEFFQNELHARSDLDDSPTRSFYLFHGYADHFYLLEFSQRSEYIIHLLNVMIKKFYEKYNINVHYKILLRGEKIPQHIERKVGYLL